MRVAEVALALLAGLAVELEQVPVVGDEEDVDRRWRWLPWKIGRPAAKIQTNPPSVSRIALKVPLVEPMYAILLANRRRRVDRARSEFLARPFPAGSGGSAGHRHLRRQVLCAVERRGGFRWDRFPERIAVGA